VIPVLVDGAEMPRPNGLPDDLKPLVRGNAIQITNTSYSEAIRFDPNNAVAYLERGNSYYSQEDYDKAIRDYSESIRLDPKYAQAYQNRGFLIVRRAKMIRHRPTSTKRSISATLVHSSRTVVKDVSVGGSCV
jgi:cytochrome c-type biogenesis protein CcmH/NrfG